MDTEVYAVAAYGKGTYKIPIGDSFGSVHFLVLELPNT